MEPLPRCDGTGLGWLGGLEGQASGMKSFGQKSPHEVAGPTPILPW